MAAGAPVSSAEHVGLALVYSAVATQKCQVEGYGRDTPEEVAAEGRWNGRAILTLGDTWTELEGPLAKLRPFWFGEYQTEKTAWQQVLTDMRPHKQAPVAPVEPTEEVKQATEKVEEVKPEVAAVV